MKFNFKLVKCDFCNRKIDPLKWELHKHKDRMINGVSQGIFSTSYDYKKNKLKPNMKFNSMWDFCELLPFDKKFAITLGEGGTPLYKAKKFGKLLGLKNVYIKDEGKNPIKSFKDRGISVVVTVAKLLGFKKIGIPSCGNAGISLSFYASKAGMESIIFLSRNISKNKLKLLNNEGTKIISSDVNYPKFIYQKFFNFLKSKKDIYNAFAQVNPFYHQGIKTIAYEIFYQLNKAPEWILAPCADGAILSAIWTGFKELEKLGLSKNIPHMICVQITDGDPINQGFNKKLFQLKSYETPNPPDSIAEGIIATCSFNYSKVIKALKESKGKGISVSDVEVKEAYIEYLSTEKKLVSEQNAEFEPTTATIFAALKKLSKMNGVDKNSDIVVIGTGGWPKIKNGRNWCSL